MNSSETKLNIQPIVKTNVNTVENFSITLNNFKLFTSVDILVCCYYINNILESRLIVPTDTKIG